MKKLLLSALLPALALGSYAQQEIRLYPEAIPNSRMPENVAASSFNIEKDEVAYNVSEPSLGVFLPESGRANGTAVIICPGGGYHVEVIGREGRFIAGEFNKLGVAAFVLRYRLPDDRIMIDKSIAPLQDAQTAIRIVRERAREWNIDPHKIGIMGFSAGGHLAATAGTHFDKPVIENPNGTSLRPDFMILVYPVISMTDSLTHTGSRGYLLGPDPDASQIISFSNEMQVTSSTPETFLILPGDDTVVKPENSLAFYKALSKCGVRSEMHIYREGEHGFLSKPPFGEWFGRVCFWMKTCGLM